MEFDGLRHRFAFAVVGDDAVGVGLPGRQAPEVVVDVGRPGGRAFFFDRSFGEGARGSFAPFEPIFGFFVRPLVAAVEPDGRPVDFRRRLGIQRAHVVRRDRLVAAEVHAVGVAGDESVVVGGLPQQPRQRGGHVLRGGEGSRRAFFLAEVVFADRGPPLEMALGDFAAAGGVDVAADARIRDRVAGRDVGDDRPGDFLDHPAGRCGEERVRRFIDGDRAGTRCGRDRLDQGTGGRVVGADVGAVGDVEPVGGAVDRHPRVVRSRRRGIDEARVAPGRRVLADRAAAAIRSDVEIVVRGVDLELAEACADRERPDFRAAGAVFLDRRAAVVSSPDFPGVGDGDPTRFAADADRREGRPGRPPAVDVGVRGNGVDVSRGPGSASCRRRGRDRRRSC